MLTVLRLNHRTGRDKRITTHCALTARALGADRMVYTGDRDSRMEENIQDVTDKWGGDFEIKYEKSWKKFLKEFNGKRIYLAMFGVPIQEKIEDFRHYDGDMVVVVGGEKVPGDIYDHVDVQVAVTNQPHSEVAALAVFLDRLQEGKELKRKFEDAELEIVPKGDGKDVREK